MSSSIRDANAPSIYRSGLFHGKVALVTGGGSGIGKCIAHELALLGCVVVIASRNADRLEAAARELRKDIGNLCGRNCDHLIHTIVCDIRNETQVKEMVEKILTQQQRIDFLVNNAGGQFRAPAEDISRKGFEAVVRLNLMGTFMVTKQVYHSYMKEHGGSIVNIIIVLERGAPSVVHSGAARAGVENMTKTLAIEWASSGIRLNCVAPGIILSSGIDNYGGDPSFFHESANTLTVAKRVGSVEEIAAATIYYLSPASAYTTGTTLCVDGGWHLVGSMIEVPLHDKTPVYGSIGNKSKL